MTGSSSTTPDWSCTTWCASVASSCSATSTAKGTARPQPATKRSPRRCATAVPWHTGWASCPRRAGPAAEGSASLEDLAHQVGRLGRGLADLHPNGLEGLLLRRGGAGRPGDDG